MLLPDFYPVSQKDMMQCIAHHLNACLAAPQKYTDLLLTIDNLQNIYTTLKMLADQGHESIWVDQKWIDLDAHGQLQDLSRMAVMRYSLSLVAKMLDDHFSNYDKLLFLYSLENTASQLRVSHI